MKPKNNIIKAKANTNANGVQKGKFGKKQKVIEAVVQVKAPVAKNNKQLKEVVAKNNKNQKKTIPPKKVIVEEEEEEEEDEDEEIEEDSENEEDSGADVEADADEPASELEDFEDESDNEELAEESDQEQESDDDEEAADEAEDNDEANSDDDEPEEKPIGKKKKADNATQQVGLAKIKCCDLPKDFPPNQVVIVKRLPKKGAFKQVDLVEVFAKYGTLDTIKPVYLSNGNSIAYIAYTTPEAAKAALAANQTEIKGATVIVMPRKDKKQRDAELKKKIEENKDRSLYIKNLRPGSTEEAIREHFSACGEIEFLKVVSRNTHKFAFITYADINSVEAALQLNNTIFDNATIGVFKNGDSRSQSLGKDPKRTLILRNKQQFDTFPNDKLEKIFSKFGEIEQIDIICRRNVLAFITFQTEDSATKALAINNTIEDDLQIELLEFQVARTNTSVFMLNVKPDVTEEEIREFFAETGEIVKVFKKLSFAIVKFADTDGFCKAFLRNEMRLGGVPVFLEPFSDQKKRVLRGKKEFAAKKRQFPFNKKAGGYGFKKPRFN